MTEFILGFVRMNPFCRATACDEQSRYRCEKTPQNTMTKKTHAPPFPIPVRRDKRSEDKPAHLTESSGIAMACYGACVEGRHERVRHWMTSSSSTCRKST